MSSPANTREVILRHGLDLLRTVGFAGITFSTLARKAGISKSGVFSHFRTKEDLELALLLEADRLAYLAVVDPAREQAKGLAQLNVFVRGWFGWGAMGDLTKACPMTHILFEVTDRPGPVRDQVILQYNGWLEVCRTMTQGAIDQKELSRSLDINEFVQELFGIFLTYFLADRLFEDQKAERRSKRQYQVLIERSKAQSAREK